MNAQEKLAGLDLTLELKKLHEVESNDGEKIIRDMNSAIEDFIRNVLPEAAVLIDKINFKNRKR